MRLFVNSIVRCFIIRPFVIRITTHYLLLSAPPGSELTTHPGILGILGVMGKMVYWGYWAYWNLVYATIRLFAPVLRAPYPFLLQPPAAHLLPTCLLAYSRLADLPTCRLVNSSIPQPTLTFPQSPRPAPPPLPPSYSTPPPEKVFQIPPSNSTHPPSLQHQPC